MGRERLDYKTFNVRSVPVEAFLCGPACGSIPN
jgi:hypothetical protein